MRGRGRLRSCGRPWKQRGHAGPTSKRASLTRRSEHVYTESRIADVAALNERLADDVAALEGLLGDTLELDDFLDFESLKETVPRPTFDPGQLAVRGPVPDMAQCHGEEGVRCHGLGCGEPGYLL